MGWEEGGQGPFCVTVTMPPGDLVFFFYPMSEARLVVVALVVVFVFFLTLLNFLSREFRVLDFDK